MPSKKRTGEDGNTSSSSNNGRSSPASKHPRWDFRSFAHFESHPSFDCTTSSSELNQQQNIQFGAGRQSSSADVQQSQDDNSPPPLYEEITHHVHKNEKFAISRHVTEFVLNAQHDEPDESLRTACDEIIQRAIRNAESEGRNVLKIGVLVDGRGK